ncbi:MAG: hypothetical protein AB7Y46_02895 [Armatimonadota bacterium]
MPPRRSSTLPLVVTAALSLALDDWEEPPNSINLPIYKSMQRPAVPWAAWGAPLWR